jgi:3-hydroxyisobutyrate dehydrogenase
MSGAGMKVGFIGLGAMGGAMALNVAKAGFALAVNDMREAAASRHVKAGATWAADIGALGASCDVVLTSLPGPPEVRAVAQKLQPAMRKGAVWIDLSTNSPTVIREIHAEFAQQGVEVLDAPVSGGPAGARSGKLALWVGGSQAAYDRIKPVLDAMGDQVIRVGDIGAGSVAKLVHNCAGFAMQLALAEAFTMGVKAGVEPLALWAAIRQGSVGRQRSFDRIGEKFLQGNYEPPNFALKLAHKDIFLATELGRQLKVPMRLAELACAEFSEAMSRGWEDRDARSFLLLQQQRVGLDFHVPREAVEEVLKNDA